MNDDNLWEVTVDFAKACATIILGITVLALLVVGVFAIVDTTIDVVRSFD